MSGHTLYTPSDFTTEELDRRNQLAIYVIEGGLGVCKRCGAAEAQLDDYADCVLFERYKRQMRNTP